MDFDSLPQKSQYKFKEVTSIAGVKPYVLRFWEAEFTQICPVTDESGQKLYSQNDLDFIKRIRDLLFEEKLSIPKAKALLDQELSQVLSPDQLPELPELSQDKSSIVIDSVKPSPAEYTGVEMREAIGNMIKFRSPDLDQYKADLAKDLEEQKKQIKARQFDDQDLLRLVKTKTKLNSLLSKIDHIIEQRGWS